MYQLIITTKYNTIELIIDDYNSDEVREILEQPYITSVELHKIRDKKKERGVSRVLRPGNEKKY